MCLCYPRFKVLFCYFSCHKFCVVVFWVGFWCVCVGKCFDIISSHVSFPISVFFPDSSFSVVTLGWMVVVRFFIFLAMASSSATVSFCKYSWFCFAFLFSFLYSLCYFLYSFSIDSFFLSFLYLSCVLVTLCLMSLSWGVHHGLLGSTLLALATG